MSSYGSPAPQGDPKATGAYSVAIAAQAGGTNNDGNATDSAGNVKVDFTWGNFPIQPNDERTENQLSNFGGSTGDTAWAATTYATATRLQLGDISAASGSNVVANKNIRSVHEIVEADYSGFPAFTSGVGKYNVTQVDGDGTTVTYQAMNWFQPGDTVDITGCGAFNLSSATVAVAKRDYFTVTNSTAGSLININNGIAALSSGATASDGAYISGTPYISVPSVIGLTTARAVDALRDSGYANGDITTASAATNSSKTVTTATRTSGSNLLSMSATAHGFSAGQLVTISGVDATANGTWVVDPSTSTNTLVVGTTPTSALSLTGLTGGAIAVSGTIKTQSTAAGTASVALGATITITPWA